MSLTRPITFAVAVNDEALFEANFLASPLFSSPSNYQVLGQQGFDSAAKAYNDAIARSESDLIVFAHQDIFFPSTWPTKLENTLSYLEATEPNWGVLGPYGQTVDGRGWGHVYSSGRGVIGGPLDYPVPIQTLDEIVLILRKSSGLRFDENLPHFHLYGADICLAAAKRGMKSYAISAFCVHNTQMNLVLPREFYECYKHVKQTWKEYLPIQTTCIRISKFNVPLYTRRVQETYLRYVQRKEVAACRLNDINPLLSELGLTTKGEKRESIVQEA